MVDAVNPLDLSQISDVVNRQNIGASQRTRNEMIRAGVQSPDSFATQNKDFLQQAQQPSSLSSIFEQPSSISNIPKQSIDTWSQISKTPAMSVRGSPTDWQDTEYNRLVNDAKKYSAAGFTPGNNVGDWKWGPGTASTLHGDTGYGWSGGDTTGEGRSINYSPTKGYQVISPVHGFSDDLSSILTVASVIGGTILPGLGVSAFGTGPGAGANLGSSFANAAGNGAVNSFVSSGGDLNATLRGGLSGGVGNAVSSWLNANPVAGIGDMGNKVLGGAASGGLNSLFSGNNVVNGSLFGAMSGGLHGFLNSTSQGTDSFNSNTDANNRRTAQQVAKLARLFTRK